MNVQCELEKVKYYWLISVNTFPVIEELILRKDINFQVYLHCEEKWSKSIEEEQSTKTSRKQSKMVTNVSTHLINSSQSPPSSDLCEILGILTWEQRNLTTALFVTIIITVVLTILTCPLTIFLNVLVIEAVRRKRYLHQKRHVLLACLAVTDLLVGAVCQPLMVVSYLQHILGVGPICLIDFTVNNIVTIACGASLFHLVIISCERYVAIKHALRYTTLVTTGRVTAAVALAWLLPVLLIVAVNALNRVLEIALVGLLTRILLMVTTSSSLLTILFCQGVVLLESRRHRKHIKAHLVSQSTAKELLKKDKAAITTTIIVAVLFVCYVPQIAFQGIAYTVENIPKSVFFTLVCLMNLLLTFNSLVNPVIYCIRTQEFRRAFRELLHLKTSHVNPHADVQPNELREPRRQREGRSGSLDIRKHTAWEELTPRHGSHSRSLDFSQGASHRSRIRRSHSV